MKKVFLILVSLIVFISINSCSEENDNYSKEDQLTEKKRRILKKFEELGLDPSKVTFSDTVNSSNAINVKSVNDLKDVLDFEIYLHNKNNIILDDDIINSKSTSTNKKIITDNNTYAWGFGSDLYDGGNYEGGSTYFQIEVPVPQLHKLFKNTFLSISFYYKRAEVHNTNAQNGISTVNSYLIGLTLGYSYRQVDYSYGEGGLSALGVRMSINGILDRNIFVEGLGTFYSSNMRTIGYFPPVRNNTNQGRFFVVSL
jgi:hypothetical protein